MANNIEGSPDASASRVAVVVSRFNEFITEKLLAGALERLRELGAKEENITVAKVPGAFEIPLVVEKLASSKKYDAVIALGCVIQGATPHFEYVSSAASEGILRAMMETGVPISFGVLTVDTVEQAIERTGEKSKNKGWDAAQTAIEMINLLKKL